MFYIKYPNMSGKKTLFIIFLWIKCSAALYRNYGSRYFTNYEIELKA